METITGNKIQTSLSVMDLTIFELWVMKIELSYGNMKSKHPLKHLRKRNTLILLCKENKEKTHF